MLALTLGNRAATANCFPGYSVGVIDGDTIKVLYQTSDETVWMQVGLRLQGIDTPEKPRSDDPEKIYPAKCKMEAMLGKEATALVKDLVPDFSMLMICEPKSDKYYGRRVAELSVMKDGKFLNIAGVLLAAGLAKEYWGGKKPSWCE